MANRLLEHGDLSALRPVVPDLLLAGVRTLVAGLQGAAARGAALRDACPRRQLRPDRVVHRDLGGDAAGPRGGPRHAGRPDRRRADRGPRHARQAPCPTASRARSASAAPTTCSATGTTPPPPPPRSRRPLAAHRRHRRARRTGRVRLSSRRSDLIIRGGENVYPAEVEGVLLEHPAVRECIVLGVAARRPGPGGGRRGRRRRRPSLVEELCAFAGDASRTSRCRPSGGSRTPRSPATPPAR